MYTYPAAIWVISLIPAARAKTARFLTEGPIRKCFTKKDADTPKMYTHPAAILVISLIPAARTAHFNSSQNSPFLTRRSDRKVLYQNDAETP